MTEHRVVLREGSYTVLDVLQAYAHGLCHLFLALQIVWYELVERWVEQTDVDWESVHGEQDAVEVLGLIRQQLGKSLHAAFLVLGKNHLAHCLDLLTLEEHVLGAAEAYAYSAEVAGNSCIVWSISIGANNELGVLVAKLHQLGEVARDLGSLGLNLAKEHLTGRTVE